MPYHFNILSFITLLLFANTAFASNTGIPGYSLAATGSGSCHACHTVSVFENNSSVVISGNNTVLAGSTNTYTFQLIAPRSTSAYYGGFNISTDAGTLIAADSESTIISGELTQSSRKLTVDTGTSFDVSWAFNWQAPTTAGSTTLSACGLPVNGDGSDVPLGEHGTDDGRVACTTFSITVQQAPTAVAGDNQTVTEGDAVSLDGSASSDTDGTISTYLWEQLSGTSAALSGANTAVASFTAPAVADNTTDELVFRLTVTDNDGLSSTSTVSVFDQDVLVSNLAPIANAGFDQSINENTLVTLDASGSSDDGTILSYAWQQTAGLTTVSLSDSAAINPTFTAPTVDASNDTLSFQLTVTDDLGVQATDTVNIVVNDVDIPPTALITDASGNAITSLNNNAVVTLYGNYSSDPDGPLTAYSWTQTAGTAIVSPGATNQNSFSFTTPDDPNTNIDIQLTVTGDKGSVQDIVVASMTLVNQPPVANAGVDQLLTDNDANPATLDATASTDTDGSIASYAWVQTGGTATVTLNNANTSTATFTLPNVPDNTTDELIFQLTVTDNYGLTATDTVSLFVQDALITNTLPVADAGVGQVVNENTLVSLDGSASIDAEDGTAITYLWTQTGGTNTVTLDDNTLVNPSFTAPAVDINNDTISFELTVTDSLGTQSTSITSVTVNNVDNPPVALITDISGASISNINNNLSVTLYGNFSTDADGAISSYSWSQTAGTAIVNPGASNQSSFSFTAPDDAGNSISIQLTVTGEAGVVQNSTTATLNLINQAPVADAGSAQLVVEGDAVTLDGTASSDIDGTITSYAWVQTAGTAATLSNANTATASFTAPNVAANTTENLSFQLTVTDAYGLNNTASVVVSVEDVLVSNVTPTANAGVDQSVNENTLVTLDGTASTDDGSIASYAWTQIAGSTVTLSSSTASQPTFTAPEVLIAGETLSFELVVTDNLGVSSSTDTVNISINNVNQAPIANAGIDQSINENTLVTLDASASGDDSSVASYAWTQTAGSTVTLSSSAASQPTFTAPEVSIAGETLSFQLIVTDDQGILSSADTVNITVNNVNQAPTANAGIDQSINENTPVTLDGSASNDVDGSIASYSWTQLAGSSVTLNNPNTATPTFTAPETSPANDTLRFQLIVTDNQSVTSVADTVDITVNNVNRAPIISLDTSLIVTEGEIVNISANVNDPDNNLSSLQWQQINCTSDCIALPFSDQPSIRFLTPAISAADTGKQLEFVLTASDSDGLISSANIILTLNDNGISDFPDDTISFTSANGQPMAIRVESQDNNVSAVITQLQTEDSNQISDTENRPQSFPFDLNNIEITLSQPGAAVQLTLYFPEAIPENMDFYQYLSDDGWVNTTHSKDFNDLRFSNILGWSEIAEEVEFSDDRRSVVIQLTDGGPSDDNATDNIISTQNGIGENPASNTEQAGATGSLHPLILLLIVVSASLRFYRAGKHQMHFD